MSEAQAKGLILLICGLGGLVAGIALLQYFGK